MSVSKKEAARRLAIIAAEIRLALDGSDQDCPSWPDDLVVLADALDPSGFVNDREAIDALTRLQNQLDAACVSLNAWEAACRDHDVRLGLILREVEGAQALVARADAAIARARVSGIDTGYTDWVAPGDREGAAVSVRDSLFPFVRYRVIHPARIWLAKLIGGEPVRHCMRGYELALRMIDDEAAKDKAAVAREWTA